MSELKISYQIKLIKSIVFIITRSSIVEKPENDIAKMKIFPGYLS